MGLIQVAKIFQKDIRSSKRFTIHPLRRSQTKFIYCSHPQSIFILLKRH
uniref:Uncharacterized protein n=1 Tax=Anguilla anguilla TaxID=7936 RepID=A0A0E9S8H8_ANGAN